mgnify:CR=1 FL=1
MRKRSALALLVSVILLGGATPALAEDASPSPSPTLSRAEQVVKFHAKYDPLFELQYKHLLVIQSKITNNASMKSAFKPILADFLQIRKFINDGLASDTQGIEVFVSYADEELGEFENTMYLLEKEIAKSKTITCIKGKTVKKVMALKPKCPTGYKQK